MTEFALRVSHCGGKIKHPFSPHTFHMFKTRTRRAVFKRVWKVIGRLVVACLLSLAFVLLTRKNDRTQFRGGSLDRFLCFIVVCFVSKSLLGTERQKLNRILTRKRWSHVRILIYQAWPTRPKRDLDSI